MSSTGTVREVQHIQVPAELCSLIGRVWTDERGVKGIYGPSMKVRCTDAAALLECTKAQVRVGSAESGFSS